MSLQLLLQYLIQVFETCYIVQTCIGHVYEGNGIFIQVIIAELYPLPLTKQTCSAFVNALALYFINRIRYNITVILRSRFSLVGLRPRSQLLFLSRLPQAWREIGIRFSVRSSVRESVLPSTFVITLALTLMFESFTLKPFEILSQKLVQICI